MNICLVTDSCADEVFYSTNVYKNDDPSLHIADQESLLILSSSYISWMRAKTIFKAANATTEVWNVQECFFLLHFSLWSKFWIRKEEIIHTGENDVH